MNEKIQRFKKLCYNDNGCSEIGIRFNSGDLNKKIEIVTAFKEMIKEQFQKVGITQILVCSDFNNWFNNFRGYFKYEDKFYYFIFSFYSKQLDICAIEMINGEPRKSNRAKTFWLSNNNLFPDKELFKLPKHRRFNVGDLVLFKGKHICKVISITLWYKIYYKLEDMSKISENKTKVTYDYISEYYLKSLVKGI